MTKKEFSVFAMALKTYYPREELLPNQQALELWYKALEDIPYSVLEVTLNKWVSLNRFSPSIADLREQATELMFGRFPDWQEGWEKVSVALGRYGYFDIDKAYGSFDDLTRKAVDQIGGFRALCKSSNLSADRANFRQAYEDMATRIKHERQLSEAVLTSIEALNTARRLGEMKELQEVLGEVKE